MNQPLEPSDFPELDDLLDESMPTGRKVSVEAKDSLDSLLDEVLRPRPVWETVASVVLIHEEHCLFCNTTTQSCQGWFASQKHATDKFAHRLVAGKPIGKYPKLIERHKMPDVEICSNCAERQIFLANSQPGSEGAH